MKIIYSGMKDEIEVRGVTFKKGKAVELDLTNPADAALAEKVLPLEDFREVKKRKKNDQDSE